MYILTQVESATPQTVSTQVNTWSPWGINLLDAPELQSGNNVINSENYNLNANWNLESRKWAIEFLSSAVWKPVRMYEKMSSNIWVFSAWNEVFYYNATTTVITSVWTYWETTDNDFVGWVSWDYLFFTNWTGKIQYVTFDYDAVNLPWTDFAPQSWNYVRDDSGHDITIYADEWGWEYQVNTNESAYVDYFLVVQGADITNASTWVWKITDYNDYWSWDERITIETIRWTNTLVWTETFDVYQVAFDWETDNETLKIQHTDASLFSAQDSVEYLPEFTSNIWDTYRVSYTWSWTSTWADTVITWFNDKLSNTDMADSSPVYFTTWSWEAFAMAISTWSSETEIFELTNFEIAIRTEVLTSWELASSPHWVKRLLVFSDWDWDRLYVWNITGDPTAIKYSALNQVKDLWEVPFQTWTSVNTPLLRTDAWGFTNSNLWELKDLWILNSEVVGLFENWKKAFHIEINTVEESWVAIQVQKIVSRERQDYWGERNPLLTQDWLFYTNESWVWQMLAMWTDVTWGPQETNISEDLGQDLVDSIDWTNCDIVNDIKKRNILVTCWLKATGYNDLILVYNLKNRSWAKYKGWNIERFLKDWESIYWTSSTETKVYELFEWTDDDWTLISTEFKFEVPLNLKTIFTLEDFLIKGEFVWDEFTVIFDTYDNKWVLSTWVKRLYADLQEVNNFSTLLTSLTRLIVTIKCTTTDQHKITYLLAWIKKIQENTFRKPYTWPTSLETEAWETLTTEWGVTIIT